jgi:hypothetical protein
MTPSELLKTNLIYGPSGAGKTFLCASFPRVAMLSSKREGGLETVEWMDPVAWYEPNKRPRMYAIENIADMMTRLYKDVFPLVKTGEVRTICIELTFHADDAMRTMPVDDKNGWAKYANLEEHVVKVDELVKRVPGLRLVYNTLAMPEDSAKGTSGVLIPGKALARKIPAMTNLTGFLHAEDGSDGIERVLELGAYGNYSPRHRYGARLPRRVRWRGPSCGYRDLEDLLLGRARTDDSGCVIREAPKVMSLPPLKTGA